MLRLAVLILLLLNAGYYAWSHGALRALGLVPAEQAEPQHLGQQIRPETLQILRTAPGAAAGTAESSATAVASAATASPPAPASEPSASSALPAASAAPGVCLQAGVFDARQAQALRTALAAWPPGSWTLEPTPVAGRWMVYLGRFADADALEKKRAELRARNVAFDRPGAALEPGLSLGRFSTEEAAQRALADLRGQDVRTARVVQERPEATGFTLRLPAVTNALRPQADALRPALAGKALHSCG